MKIKEMH